MKVKISAVSRKEKTSAKTGKPFTSLGLKTEQHGDKWLSGFGNKDNAGWKVGDEVEIEVVQKGEYLNFETPKKEDKQDAKLEQILNAIVGLRLEVADLNRKLTPKPKNEEFVEPNFDTQVDVIEDFPDAE